jgi:formate dehydrogenase major subunit
VQHADCFIVIGANPTVNHPVAATFMKNAIERGAKLILIDPRRTELARLATHVLQFRPDTDVALLNAMLHTIVEEDLVDHDFVARRTHGYDELVRGCARTAPKRCSTCAECRPRTIRAGRPALRDVEGIHDLLGHGHLAARPRHRQRALPHRPRTHHRPDRPPRHRAAPAARTEQRAGRVGHGAHPVFYPDYRSSRTPRRARSSRSCGAAGPRSEEGADRRRDHERREAPEIRGMYIMGENPAMSDPDVQHAREALAALDWLVVQDLFLTETASFADVILPASAFPEKTGTFTNTDRRVQLGRQALPLPGDTRQDLWIIAGAREAAWGSHGTTPDHPTSGPRSAGPCRAAPASRGSASSGSTA